MERPRNARAGHRLEQIESPAPEPRFAGIVERRRAGKRVEQRQIAPQRRHDADSTVRIAESGMHMHAVDHQPPRCLERLAQHRHRVADFRVRLDLGAEKLVHDPMRTCIRSARFKDARVGILQQVSEFRIDQEEFFLDTEGDRQVVVAVGSGHDSALFGIGHCRGQWRHDRANHTTGNLSSRTEP